MFDADFRPYPLFRGGHLQTIFGSYWGGKLRPLHTQRHTIELPDADRLVLHEDLPVDPFTDAPIMLLVHGLGGCHASGYVRRTAFKLNQRGVRTVRLDLRGHGAGLELAQGPGHAGRSEDVAAAVTWIANAYPQAKLQIAGFSLGANIVLKLAGEWHDRPPTPVARLLAVAPPIDLQQCSAGLIQGFNRFYDQIFVRSVLGRVKGLVERGIVPGPVPFPKPRTLREFDNVYTAIRSGFKDVEDYYAQASSGPLLPRISLPTTIVAAADDPIVPAAIFTDVAFSPTTRLVVTPSGGHLGYLSANRHDPDWHWLDWRIVEWALQDSPQ